MKRARVIATERTSEREAEASELGALLQQTAEHSASLQTTCDKQNQQLQRRLPIACPREDDSDLLAERLKLRMVRPTDRAKQLHEAVVSALKQAAQSGAMQRESASALAEVEGQLADLRRLDAGLRSELAERRGEAESQREREREAEVQREGAQRSKRVIVEVASPHGLSHRVAVEVASPLGGSAGADEDADMLYGAAPPRAALPARTGGPADAGAGGAPRFGALFGRGRGVGVAGRANAAPAGATAPAPIIARPTATRVGSTRRLFENRAV
eukprot:NODE_1949_length_1029_cov_129.537988.p1 GENE.NODE_1949_length_1029_cov_129.537988~~NODE_1949_length_1029_cov_129.537988.p1  ORF type:complete len:272 (+),score=70.58 NODE_1949_length_1029_cov_129.537988:132-947(+)